MKLIPITIGVVFLVGCGKVKDEITSRLGGAGAEESSEKILENSQVSDTSDSEEELLGLASRNGDLAKVKKLLAEGANVDPTEETGMIPIVEAAREGHMEDVAALLAHGAGIDGGALYFSLKNRKPEVAEMLILCGAALDKKYQSHDDPPLINAIREKLYDVGALMVVKGVNLNVHGKFSRPPLDEARGVPRGFPVFLREHGALTAEEIENGGTIDPEVTGIILDEHRSYNDINPETGPNLDIHIAVHFRDEATLRKIIEIGANLDAVNETGDTPLMSATMFDRFKLAKMLIDAGVNINFNNNGRTALHYAVKYNKINIVKLFLENGVDVNVQDQYGDTPLDDATSSITRSDKSRQIVNLLRSNGAKTGDVVDEVKRQAEANKPKTFPVFLAALEGNMDEVRQRLDAGLAVNSRDGIGDTLLHNAAWKGHGELAEYLVSQKADVNALNKRNRSPLHYSVFLGQKDVANFLISKGADVNPNDAGGRTPLDWAILLGKHDLAELIKSNGGKETSPSLRTKITAVQGEELPVEDIDIHSAAYDGDLESVIRILEDGMDINSKDADGSTVLHYAVSGGEEEVIQHLITNGADVDSLNDQKNSPLHIAAHQGAIKSAALLVKKGADVNLTNEEDESPLHLAAEVGQLEVVKLLVKQDADVNEGYRSTPLDHAHSEDHKEVIAFLEKNGAYSAESRPAPILPVHNALLLGDLLTIKKHLVAGTSVNTRDQLDFTLMHRAAERGDKVVVDLLLAKGAMVDLRDRNTFTTPLHSAASNGHREIVLALIEHEAEVDWVDKTRRTPLHLAAKNGHEFVADVLLSNKAPANILDEFENAPLHFAIQGGHFAVVKRLVEADADINLVGGPLKETPIHLAVQNGKPDLVKYLLDQGADVNGKNKIGKTPLHQAASLGLADVATVLLSGGADVNRKDSNLSTPLHEAVGAGKQNLAKLLIENKAGINTRGPFGETPLDFASEHPEIEKYLRGIGAKTDDELKAEGR